MHLYACYIQTPLHTGYDSSLIMVYNGYTYYHIDSDASICVYALCRLYPGYEPSPGHFKYGMCQMIPNSSKFDAR